MSEVEVSLGCEKGGRRVAKAVWSKAGGRGEGRLVRGDPNSPKKPQNHPKRLQEVAPRSPQDPPRVNLF